MKCAKYLVVPFVGTLIYVLLCLGFGQNSISSFKNLEEQKRIISKQKAEIQNINSELLMEYKALKDDYTVIEAYARKLGYVSEGEKIIKVKGLKTLSSNLFDAGTIIRHQEVHFLSESFCKASAIIVASLFLLIMILVDVKHGEISFSKKDKSFIAGIPCYDLPQI